MMHHTINSRVSRTFVTASVLLGFGVATSVFAETVYIWRDGNGVRQYADACPANQKCRTREIGSMRSKRQAKWRQRIETTAANASTTEQTGSATGGDTTSDNSTDDTTSTGHSASDSTALLEWDAVTVPGLNGYRVYHAAAGGPYPAQGSGIHVGTSTSYEMAGLPGGTRYYFRVTSVDTSGNESSFSNEVYKDIP
jgi:Fibronectin type III domain/Domain of unknown function (DUF4124)